MSGITHKQAIQLVHRRLDGLLNQRQILSLDEHLHSCDECNTYASEMELLPLHLRHEFHTRWDKQHGPSKEVLNHVMTKAGKILMMNRISSAARLFASAAALIVLIVLVNLIFSQLHNTTVSTSEMQTRTSPSLPISAENRLIAFTRDQNGNMDIYIMHADGTGLTNITNNPASDNNPFWSPDGKQIVFESDRDGSRQIYLMDADGSNIVQLTNDQPDHFLPFNIDGKTNPWSSDGGKLLFLQSQQDGETFSLNSIDISGANRLLLGLGRISLSGISWSPNGKYVWYVLNAWPDRTGFDPNIYVVDADGRNSRQLKKLIPNNKQLGIYYQWSPDGKSVIFTTTQTVYELDLVTNTLLEKNTLPRVVDWQNDVTLTWAKDFVWHRSDGVTNTLAWEDSNCLTNITRSSHGNFAIGAYCPDSHKFKFYWANADGSAIKQLLDSSEPAMIGEIGDITWSSDDQYVAFTLAAAKTSLYILNVNDALNDPSIQPVKISKSFSPSWQPISNNEIVEEKSTPAPQASNRLIAFTSPQDGNSDIFIMNTDGTGIQNITNNLATDRNPVWSPDGQKIAFESDRDGKFDVYIINADGSNLTQITTDPAFDSLASSYDSPWSPDGKRIVIQSNRSGHEALYITSIDGKSEAVKISDTSGFVVWSPMGNQVAYSYISEKSGLNNNTEQDAIRIINADGSNEQNIVQTGLIRTVHWSTDGKTLYYINGWSIEGVETNGGTPETILNIEDPYVLESAWFSPDSTIVYQSLNPEGLSSSLYRLKAGKSSLVGQLRNQSEACELTTYYAQGVVLSHDTNQAISSVNCGSGQTVFAVHDLTNNTTTLIGELVLVNPEISVSWSQDDQMITIRVIQSDVSQSSGLQASLYVLRREELSHPPTTLNPVIEQTNGLTITAIQPTPRREFANLPTPEPTQIHSYNGLIAFTSKQNGNLDIYTVRSDGSEQANLTDNPANDYSPTWSPDGTRLAFVSNRDTNDNIYVMNADGSNLTRLTDDPGSDTNPVWSPDGTKIAYSTGDFSTKVTNIYVVDSNGQNHRRITNYAHKTTIWPVTWSPDNQFILFDISQQIVKVNVNSGDVKPVMPPNDLSYQFTLSKDGSTLHYLVDCNQNTYIFCNRVKTINEDGTNEKSVGTVKVSEVCPVKQTSAWMGWYTKWSPDRTKILFFFTCEENGWIYIANADGSDFKPLTNYPILGNGPENEVAMGDWSPDNQSIVFMSALNHPHIQSLYILNINEALQNLELRPTLLSASATQVWSPAWQPIP